MAVPRPPFINNLPYEMLANIFGIALEDELAESADRFKWPVHIDVTKHQPRSLLPVRVSSVCSLWRHVALQSGLLWTTIDYGYDQSKEQTIDEVFGCRSWGKEEDLYSAYHKAKLLWPVHDLPALYAQRSRGALVSLKFTGGPSPYYTIAMSPPALRCIVSMIRLVMQTLPRLQYLKLKCFPFPILERILTELRSAPAPHLRCLDLDIGLPQFQPTNLDALLSGVWHNLIELRVGHAQLEIPFDRLPCLKRLTLEGTHVDLTTQHEYFVTLAKCTNLEELNFVGIFEKALHEHTSYSNVRLTNILLDRLHTLRLIAVPKIWARHLTSCLTAPALRTVVVSDLYFPTHVFSTLGPCINCLHTFDLARVELFRWQNCDLSKEKAAELLGALCGLVTLELPVYSPGVEFLAALTDDADVNGAQQLCPRLETLRILSQHDPTSDISRVLSVRRASGHLSTILRLDLQVSWTVVELTDVERLYFLVSDLNVGLHTDNLYPMLCMTRHRSTIVDQLKSSRGRRLMAWAANYLFGRDVAQPDHEQRSILFGREESQSDDEDVSSGSGTNDDEDVSSGSGTDESQPEDDEL